jgi:site-specific recombinase XerD
VGADVAHGDLVRRNLTVKLMKAAKSRDVRFHDCRHHFATRLVVAGADVNAVRGLLGPCRFQMTLRYSHLAPEHKASAVEQLLARL